MLFESALRDHFCKVLTHQKREIHEKHSHPLNLENEREHSSAEVKSDLSTHLLNSVSINIPGMSVGVCSLQIPWKQVHICDPLFIPPCAHVPHTVPHSPSSFRQTRCLVPPGKRPRALSAGCRDSALTALPPSHRCAPPVTLPPHSQHPTPTHPPVMGSNPHGRPSGLPGRCAQAGAACRRWTAASACQQSPIRAPTC